MDDLAVEIAEFDGIPVDDAESADAGSSQVESSRGAEATGSYNEDGAAAETALGFWAKGAEDDLAAVAGDLVGGEAVADGIPCRWWCLGRCPGSNCGTWGLMRCFTI